MLLNQGLKSVIGIAPNNMSHDVNVPLGRPLEFPNSCPFSGVASPKSTVTLRKSSSSMIIPIPGIGLYNAYSRTSLRVPACRRIAFLAVILQLAMWFSFLGGFAVCVLLINTSGDKPIDPVPPLLTGVCLSVFFRVARFFVLSKVRIRNAWGGFVEVRFRSKDYARHFCELNRLPLLSD